LKGGYRHQGRQIFQDLEKNIAVRFQGLRRQEPSGVPGVVDAHMHAGIYAPLKEDAVSESRAAAQAA